ncbi:MAG: cytochrome c [Thermoflavifilum sp.]|nr:cytochrome c [Thermoflavifilum sp.]
MNKLVHFGVMILMSVCLALSGSMISKAWAADSTAVSGNADHGKQLFEQQACNSCHNINQRAVGPALAGVDQRRSLDWIVKFVRSPKAMIDAGDPTATALYNEYHIIMPDHPSLNQQDIQDILAYIAANAQAAPSSGGSGITAPATLQPNYLPLSFQKNAVFFISFLFVVMILVIVLLFAVKVKDVERSRQERKA